MLNNKKKKKGFTLIELIIVIAIIAVLAAVAMPKFGEIRKNANIKADIATAKNIHSALTAKVQENSLSTVTAADIEDVVGGQAKSKLDTNKTFNVKLDDKNNVIVYVGEISTATQVYPEPKISSGTTNNWYPSK